MSKRAWFSLGIAAGIDLLFLIDRGVAYLESRAARYVRAPGSSTVTITGRKPE